MRRPCVVAVDLHTDFVLAAAADAFGSNKKVVFYLALLGWPVMVAISLLRLLAFCLT
jgi:hypothetical protein